MDDPFVWGGEEEPRTEAELQAEGGSPVASTEEEVVEEGFFSRMFGHSQTRHSIIAEGGSPVEATTEAETEEVVADDSTASSVVEETASEEEEDLPLTLNERVYDNGEDPMEIMGDGDRLTGTFGEYSLIAYTPAAYATKHKRCLLLHTKKTKSIILSDLSEYNRDIPLAYWNETLQGYIIRPTRSNVEELCEWLDDLNEGCDHGDDYSEEREDEDYDY